MGQVIPLTHLSELRKGIGNKSRILRRTESKQEKNIQQHVYHGTVLSFQCINDLNIRSLEVRVKRGSISIIILPLVPVENVTS